MPELAPHAQDHRIRRILLLAIVLAIPVVFSLRLNVVSDPDIWWHLRTGQWIMEHRALPINDPFSSFGAGNPWVAYSWTFDLAAYGLYRAFGMFGILLFQSVLALGTALALFALARRFTNSVVGLALTAAGLFAMVPMYAPRPWLLTVLLFTCETHLLLAWSEDGSTRRLLWLIPLFALWANIHIQFVYGLLALGLACLEPAATALAGYVRLRDTRTIRQQSAGYAAGPLWVLLPACRWQPWRTLTAGTSTGSCMNTPRSRQCSTWSPSFMPSHFDRSPTSLSC